MKLEILYKKTKKDQIQTWEIEIEGNKFRTHEGIKDMVITSSEWTICVPNNVGRSNATTAEEQALKEAKAKWQKKIDSGYVLNINNVDDKKYFEPMLAHKWRDYGDKVTYPLFCQKKYDGCLFHNSKIQTDKGIFTIEEIVNNKIECNVLSYNEITQKNEYKPIINWFNNGNADYKQWMYIKILNGEEIRCTKNHKILTNNGWKDAITLNSKIDLIYSTKGSNYLNSLIIGSILGDSQMIIEKRHSGRSYRLSFQHTNKELFDFKKKILNLDGNVTEVITGYGSNAWRYVSNALTKTDFPITKFYWTGNCNNEIIKEDWGKILGKRKLILYSTLRKYMTLESLSLWIADDGSLSYNNGDNCSPLLSLNTQGFSEKQINEFIKYFKKSYKCIPSKYIDEKVINGSGIYLRFSTKDTLFILNKLRKKQVKGVEYKFYFPTEGYIEPVVNEYGFNKFNVHNSRNDKLQIKYDIEVLDNHNYYANNILVHNCRSIISKDGMFTRNGKPIIAAPHIFKSIKGIFNLFPNLVLDGELYFHSKDDNFNKIVSLVRKTKPTEDDYNESEKLIQYHCYDCYLNDNSIFSERNFWLKNSQIANKYIILADTYRVDNYDELVKLYNKFLDNGYEGLMIRLDTPYENKRSKNLLKMKPDETDEFIILDILEGLGNKSNMAGALVCKINDNTTFNSNIKGGFDLYKELWNNKEKYIGKTATIRYQNLTIDGVPRFPYCIAIDRESFE